jgi:serine/threonine protein kinase
MSSDREEHSQVRVRQFAAVNLDGHHFPEAAIGRLVAAADFDLEDEWCDPASGAWRPLWVLDGVPRPLHWDALQRRHGSELAERRRRVEAGELARKAYIDWRALQLRLLASEGAATVVGQEGPPPAQDDVDLMWLLGQVPKHIRDLYPPVRELGRGGSGRVYLVKLRHSEALCALKLTRAGLGKQAVLNELKALERVRSQHVVSVRHYEPIDEGEDGRWLIVSEYVDGPTLQQYRLDCPDRRVSDPVVLRDLLLGIARGLADLHRHGVVHRDLKPANVILRGGLVPGVAPMPVIIDLGMSRGTGGMTLLGGTPGYQSPEQEAGERCTPASDVFVFGLVAYELATGRRLTGARLQRLHEVCPGLPPVLDELVKERCASAEVSERLADGAALLNALEAAFDSGTPKEIEVVSVPEPDSRQSPIMPETPARPVAWAVPGPPRRAQPIGDDRPRVPAARVALAAHPIARPRAKSSSAVTAAALAAALFLTGGVVLVANLALSGQIHWPWNRAASIQPDAQRSVSEKPPVGADDVTVMSGDPPARRPGPKTNDQREEAGIGREFVGVVEADRPGIVRFVRLGNYRWAWSWDGRYSAGSYEGVLLPEASDDALPRVLARDAGSISRIRAFVSGERSRSAVPQDMTAAGNSLGSAPERSNIGRQFIRVRDAESPSVPRFVRVGDYAWEPSASTAGAPTSFNGVLRSSISDGSPRTVKAVESDAVAKIRAFKSAE